MQRRAFVLGAATAGVPGVLHAQGVVDASMQAALVRTGLYVIAGEGGNTLVRLSGAGILLVDGQPPGHYRPLMSQVRRLNRLGDLPVRAVVLTDHHAHHAGTHLQFLGAGIPAIVQTQVRARLPVAAPVAGRVPAEVVVFEREQTLRLGAVEVRLLHVGPAHTDGDTVVHFPDIRVVAVGDLYTANTPTVDVQAGGSLAGWVRALGEILALDVEIVVPGEGPMLTRADLQAFKGRMEGSVSSAST